MSIKLPLNLTVKKSPIHSKGVFAKSNIAKGTRIIEYVGEKITNEEADRRFDASQAAHNSNEANGAVYVFEINKKYSIDGNVPYNAARHINHSCDPNAKTDVIRGKIWIIATRNIKAGEEITYNYGYDFSEDYKTQPCRCGSPKCVGYILHRKLWPLLRKAIAKSSLLILLLASPCLAYEWTPVDPKHDDPVKITPSVCMVYHFGTSHTDPLYPGQHNNLVEGADGAIYGAGDNGNCAACYGKIWKFNPKDNTLAIVHEFDGIEGNAPNAGLSKGPGNSFLGTTYGGGKVEVQSITGDYTKNTDVGTIYSFSPGGKANPIWSFRNNWLRKINCKAKIGCDPPWTDKEKKDAPPSYPWSPPVTNLAGKVMGVTPFAYNNRFGALYSLNGEYSTVETMDGTKALKLLSLSPGVTDNNFYGVSALGPTGNLFGTVFKTSGGPIEVIHTFNGDDGASPTEVIQGKDKKLYGTTYWGGKYRRQTGLLYQMNADGSGYKVLHTFDGDNGSNPVSRLVWGKDNRLYGSTRYGGSNHGVVFRIHNDGSNFTVLHKFIMRQTGKGPMGNMIQHSSGDFYGTTNIGGRMNGGGIFRLYVGQSKPEGMDYPGQRYCCSLGQNVEFSNLTTAPNLDPGKLSGHKYGTQKEGDPIGYVYTSRAGLLDIGHVRDSIDMVRFLYYFMMTSDRNNLQQRPVTNGIVRPIQLPMDQEQILKIASAMTYIDGLAHELVTWGQGFTKKEERPVLHTPQDFSSFSPEDLVSNVVGIEIAERVLRGYCDVDFNTAVDEQMEIMMLELGAQPVKKTEEVRKMIQGDDEKKKEGKWYTEDVGFRETLWRRNFSVWAWPVPYQNLGAHRIGWINATRFEPYYKYFDYGVTGSVDGETGIYIGNMFKKVQELRQKWEAENPGMTRWP